MAQVMAITWATARSRRCSTTHVCPSASVSDAKNFDNGRQFAAWLGVVPRQHSSGGKPTLLGMSNRGDAYLRTMLIHGARSVIYRVTQRADAESWLVKLTTRRNKNIAAVALANKNARTIWALLAHERDFRTDYAARKDIPPSPRPSRQREGGPQRRLEDRRFPPPIAQTISKLMA